MQRSSEVECFHRRKYRDPRGGAPGEVRDPCRKRTSEDRWRRATREGIVGVNGEVRGENVRGETGSPGVTEVPEGLEGVWAPRRLEDEARRGRGLTV